MRVSASDCALEHSVFASRMNSCIRKSNLRPTGPGLSQQRARGGDMGGQAVKFFGDIVLDGDHRQFLRQPGFVHPIGILQHAGQLLAQRVMRGGAAGLGLGLCGARSGRRSGQAGWQITLPRAAPSLRPHGDKGRNQRGQIGHQCGAQGGGVFVGRRRFPSRRASPEHRPDWPAPA